MSAYTRIPDEFNFEHQGGNFTVKKSVWQNTLDKSVTTFVINLDGFGEYNEVKIPVNTDDWVADAIASINEHTLALALGKFVETGDPEVTESLVEAVTAVPDEELETIEEIVEDNDNAELPFEPVIEEVDIVKENTSSDVYVEVPLFDIEPVAEAYFEEPETEPVFDEQFVETTPVTVTLQLPNFDKMMAEAYADNAEPEVFDFSVNTDIPNSQKYGFSHSHIEDKVID